MSDNGEVEVENPTSMYPVLPKEVTAEIGSVKLFNKWSYEDVEIRDISLTYALDHGPELPVTSADGLTCLATTSRSGPPCTSPTQPADMRPSDSEKHNARSSSA